ncbi:MAG: M28 family peptidase [Longimicrobiales bacterium]|nr:M28 family peptidase [Longimicrobiales bacterium]
MSAQDTAAARQAAAGITPELIRQHVFALADDSMRGRRTPSPELEAATQYAAVQLRRAGLRPGGEGQSYFQRYPVDQVRVLADSAALWTTGTQPMRWTYGVEYAPHPYNDFADWTAQGSAVLLVGALGGPVSFDTVSLRGRVLVVPLSAAGFGPNFGRIANWQPAAVLRVVDVPDSSIAQLARSAARPTTRIPGAIAARPPMLVVTDRAAHPLISRAGVDLAELRRTPTDRVLRAIPLGDAVVHVRLRTRPVVHQNPANVIAILEGADPALRSEYVVYTAHMDHLGVGDPIAGDSIYNGADDNASGTAAVLAVAHAFASLPSPPRRSVMFVLVTGEEGLGGGGSVYFLRNPPVPVSVMVADLNADMVGRNWRDTVVVVGRRDSDLGHTVDSVTAVFPELGLAVADTSTRPGDASEVYYLWSDHAAFIRRGVPFLYFYSGMHADYHGPGDSPDKIDVEKLARISRLMFYTGVSVANADTRPQWDPDRHARLVPRR